MKHKKQALLSLGYPLTPYLAYYLVNQFNNLTYMYPVLFFCIWLSLIIAIYQLSKSL